MALKKIVSVEEVISLLNEMVTLDPVATCLLLSSRVPCNGVLANHPTIQVHGYNENNEPTRKYKVGLLGVLNGIFGVEERTLYGCISAEFDTNGNIARFVRITDFSKYPSAKD